MKEYPVACGPLTRPQPATALPKNAVPGPVTGLAFDAAAGKLAVCTVASAVRTLRLPVSRHAGAGDVLLGHDARVHTARFSHDGGMLLTASADKTARLWALRGGGSKDAAIVFDKDADGKPHAAEVKDAAFFYLDRFVLLACGAALRLYSFKLDDKSRLDDVSRLAAGTGRYRKAHAWVDIGGAHAVSAMACVNSVLSHLVLAATTDRAVHLLDAASGKVVRTIPDAHARAAHTLRAPTPSAAAAVPRSALDVFASAATDGAVKLWDLRDRCACAGSLSGHVNRRERVGVDLSPCLRYLAAGSEDGRVHVYDLRTHLEVAAPRGHTDVVSAVAYNPLHPQLATGSYDGTVRLWTEEAGA